MNNMKHLDLFSGYGGFTISAEKHGIETIGFNEIDKYAIKVLNYHYPNIKNYGDISKTDFKQFNGKIGLVTGGSPCQDLSVAGKRKGLTGERSGLFFEFIRAIKDAQPEYFIWENVKGALSSNGGWDFARVQIEMEQAGYEIQWAVLNAKDFGVPQNRERIFVIGTRNGSTREILPLRENAKSCYASKAGAESKTKHYTAITTREGGRKENNFVVHNLQPRSADRPSLLKNKNAGGHGHLQREDGLSYTIDTACTVGVEIKPIDDIMGHGTEYKTEIFGALTSSYYKGIKGDGRPAVAVPVLTPDRLVKRQNGRRFKENGDPSFTLAGQDRHGVMVYDDYNSRVRNDGNVGSLTTNIGNEAPRNGTKLIEGGSRIRRLTPVECERLMGLEDNWTLADGISDTQRYKLCGNGVVVNCVDYLLDCLLNF